MDIGTMLVQRFHVNILVYFLRGITFGELQVQCSAYLLRKKLECNISYIAN